MTTELLMEKIMLPLKGQETVKQFILPEEEYMKWKECFYEERKMFFKQISERADKKKLVLVLYLRFAAELYEEFVKRGIPDQIYFDTFKDLTIWYQCCVKKNGECGLIEEWWLSLPLDLKIFRLGRLQFEPGELSEDVEAGEKLWKKGSKVLHVHIPEGEPLTETLCDESFAAADKFFGKEYEIFDCDSWLLSPALEKILSEESNVLKFLRRFQICGVSYKFRQAEERIFGEIREDKENYPEHTSLQRKAKEYVLNGGRFGIGYGIIRREQVKELSECYL